MSKLTLGKTPTAKVDTKDAVHIAVVVRKADRFMVAGERTDEGIVDPFGPLHVHGGSKYLLLVDPDRIARLTHEWELREAPKPVEEEDLGGWDICCPEEGDEDACC